MLYLTNNLFCLVTPPYSVISPPTIPPNPPIILTYLCHSGTDDRTADSVHLGGGRGLVDTFPPARTPVLAVIYVLPSASIAMNTISLTLKSDILNRSLDISPMTTLYVASASAPVL